MLMPLLVISVTRLYLGRYQLEVGRHGPTGPKLLPPMAVRSATKVPFPDLDSPIGSMSLVRNLNFPP